MTTETMKSAKSAVSKPAPAATRATPLPVASPAELPRYETTIFTVLHEPAHGVTLEDVMRPAYWGMHTKRLGHSRWTEIVVLPVNGSWEARLRVEMVVESGVHMRLLSAWTSPAKADRVPEGYSIDFSTGGWRVRVPVSEEAIVRQFPTEHLAAKAAIEHALREPV